MLRIEGTFFPIRACRDVNVDHFAQGLSHTFAPSRQGRCTLSSHRLRLVA